MKLSKGSTVVSIPILPITIVFIFLKLIGAVEWDWLWVLCPLWIPVLVVFSVIVVVGVVLLFILVLKIIIYMCGG